ncbi:hypothetical protein J7E62_09325 [Variovorax paradoxus]|nr:hypothetical protein [Variovorax paradoxus]
MIEKANPPEAGWIDSEDTGPTWAEMRGSGCMLIDTMQKLAVYAGGSGAVILMEQSFDDAKPHYVVIDNDVVPKLIAALTKAQVESAEVFAAEMERMEAELAAHEATAQEQGASSGDQ